MRTRVGIVPVVAVAISSCLAGTAEAACMASDITGISYTSTSLSPYNPFTSYSPKLVTVTVSATSTCAVELAFLSPTVPARMSGPAPLSYDVQLSGSATSLLYGGGTPPNTAHIDIGVGNVGSASVLLSVPAGQVVPDGSYSDANLVTHIFDKAGTTFTLLKTAAMPVSGSVAKVCEFTAPRSVTLNFTSAIANGRPNPGHVQSVAFNGVSCTAPTIVRLSGDAMQLQPAGAASGFDHFINYRATATFNAAIAELNTSVPGEASSVTRNTSSGATVDGSISVDVSLLAGEPLLAGTYAAILTLSIDPSP
jgi:hypothetical protein